jgi:hypothetical protein
MTALLSVPIYQKISLASKIMEKKYCFIVCYHVALISSQSSLHGLVIKYNELHGFRSIVKCVKRNIGQSGNNMTDGQSTQSGKYTESKWR